MGRPPLIYTERCKQSVREKHHLDVPPQSVLVSTTCSPFSVGLECGILRVSAVDTAKSQVSLLNSIN